MTDIPGGRRVNCADCLKRPTCTALCAEAERYVNQDNVRGGRELTVSNITYQSGSPWSDEPQEIPYVSDRDTMIATLLSSGIPRDKVRKQFGISSTTLRKVIQRLRRKL